jgi:hypothetical protein
MMIDFIFFCKQTLMSNWRKAVIALKGCSEENQYIFILLFIILIKYIIFYYKFI